MSRNMERQNYEREWGYMTRDEAIKAAWAEIFSSAESILEDDLNEQETYTDDDWQAILGTTFDIMRSPSEYTAWL